MMSHLKKVTFSSVIEEYEEEECEPQVFRLREVTTKDELCKSLGEKWVGREKEIEDLVEWMGPCELGKHVEVQECVSCCVRCGTFVSDWRCGNREE